MTVYLWAKAAFLAAAFLALTGCHHHMLLRTSIVRSNFIFAATVQQVGGSGAPDFFRARRETLTVRVTRAFTAEFQEFVGQTVTIRLLADSPVKTRSVHGGENLIFLANPLFYGDTLAVEAEARKPSATLEQQVSERPELLLADRVRSAEVIVYGTVRSTPEPSSDGTGQRLRARSSVGQSHGEHPQCHSRWRSEADRRVLPRKPRLRLVHRAAIPRAPVRHLAFAPDGSRRRTQKRPPLWLCIPDFLEGNTPAETVRLLARTNPYAASSTKPEG